ncbi:hypothetical protein FJZ20_02805 [Candidatus Pacearchaeota archaeon]|nr:hypothetical protein [Candidatus Pacearchaeota archaeon]
MGISCPNCSQLVIELMACDSCQTIGCIRCVSKSNKQWLCPNCKSGRPKENVNIIEKNPEMKKESSDLFSMFG